MLDPPDIDSKDPGNAKVHSARAHSFAFDYSYCGLCRQEYRVCVRLIVRVRIGSAGDKDDEDYASQQTLFNDLGVELLDNAFQGFNACIFACG